MYDKVDADMNFVKRETEVLAYWKENKIFEKSVRLRENGPPFTFYDGPPTANGRPHIGHVETRAIKDLIPRYRAMKGYNTLRKAGWDTHGLPVELEVEKALGISGKPEIEKYGVEPFIQQCKESVWKYKNEWEEMSDRVAFWADMDEPYVTYHNSYIESEWWALKQIWEKGLLYKGHKILPYCPRCGTSLSSHEVAQGYKDVRETSVFAKFKVKGEDTFILAWTTTPWTLPSNVALAVNAKEEYCRVKQGSEVYIMAKALVSDLLKEDFDVIETFPGASIEGMEYENLFGFYESDKKHCYVVCDNYVTLNEGTGVVHIAPAFGEDDSRLGKIYDLPFIQLVNAQGLFTESVKPWAGVFVKEADPLIIKYMKETGKLFRAMDFEHSYPFCWRCDTPLLYYARDAWFIKMTALRDELLANNDAVNWMPDNIKTGRFGDFLANVVDWNLSRERYWGTPLPVWECELGHRHVVGGIEELRELSPETPADIELHKPYIDSVTFNCPECGGVMRRVPEVIDCWFDSGAMPFAQWHYPFENKEKFEKFFPADFISEALDQTRGWFYSLIAIGTLVFGTSPFKNCIVMGLVMDKDGVKMSKHKGNVVDPWSVLNKQGADASRWYFYSSSAPWLPSRFHDDALNEAQRKFMGTFWNTYAFYVLYAEIDQFNPAEYSLEYDKLSLMDKWVLSRLHSLIREVDENLEHYEITDSARALNNFVDELSNWYVRRGRERYWGNDMSRDKINAYMTLYHVLVNLAKICAPFIPFMTEAIYLNLVKNLEPQARESVHLTDFPRFNPDWINADLEANMDRVLRIVTLGRAARNEAAIKNRQPLARMYVKSEQKPSEEFNGIILNELNVKEIEYTDDVDAFTAYSIKPELRSLGRKYGKQLPAISRALAAADGNALMKSLKQGNIILNVDGQVIELQESELLISAARREGFSSANDRGVNVVLSVTLTPELINEGLSREIISKVQTMRREAGFEVTDRIRLFYKCGEKLSAVFELIGGQIAEDVLANEITLLADDGIDGTYIKEWNINGEYARLGVRRV
ncbi:MAG: isoleucine--tRNA ligase [Clostridiales bacterium]|jgi:isoleucyl-tRNA synthetase|nr:isoleucine--tRNA ligase [Clostridiales bacterium]